MMSSGTCEIGPHEPHLLMKTIHEPQVESEAGIDLKITRKYESIKLGIDWHAREYRVTRIIDGSGPQPAQRFTPEAFLRWVAKQKAMAVKVYSCYEAGAGGFVLHRQLEALGVISYVIAPRDLDREHRGVQNDKTDSRELALDLERYVLGNRKAMRPVYIPTPEQEQRRQQSRQRAQLVSHRLSLAAQGRSLLLGQGFHYSNSWWKPVHWLRLSQELPGWMVEALEIYRKLIVEIDREAQILAKTIQNAAAKTPRPKGLGALTSESLDREICSWERFSNRKNPGSYAGLVGGVSATGSHAFDLPITKAGSSRLRGLMVEAAWRWVIHQPQCKLIQHWRATLLNRAAHARARKRAIIAVARQLLVDLWRWKTGRETPEHLGWIMT
jgi:transposase